MYKSIIFWSKLKLITFTLSMLLLILGCFNDTSKNIIRPTEPSVETPDKLPPITSSISFALNSVPDVPPHVQTWIITDSGNTATTKNFSKLRDLLNEATNNTITLVFPNITAIPNGAFFTEYPNENQSIISVNAPQAETIGNAAFRKCKGLKSIDFPKAKTIGSMAFSSTTALTNINLPEATSIGSMAFSYTTALTNINLPKATFIERNAFSFASALMTMTLATKSDLEIVIHPIAFSNVATCNITVVTSYGVARSDKKWQVESKTFGPFKEIIIKK